MPENVRLHDPFRDPQGQSSTGQKLDNAMELASDEVPDTDPSASQTKTKTFVLAAKTVLVDLAATPAIAIDEDGATVTSVTYKPAGNQSAPASSNSRTWTLAGTEGSIATFLLDSSKSFVSGTPVAFTISHAAVSEEVLTIASAHAGTSGAADPGGTLTVVYSF